MDSRLKLGIVIGALGVAGGLAWMSQVKEVHAQTTSGSTGPNITLSAFGGDSGAIDGLIGTVTGGTLHYIPGAAELTVSAVKDTVQYHCTMKFQDQAAMTAAVQLVFTLGKASLSCGGTFAGAKRNKSLTTENFEIKPM